MTPNDPCAHCGSRRFERTTFERFVVVDGETFAGTVRGLRCKTCRAESVAHDIVTKFDEVAVLVARGTIDVDPFHIRRAPRAAFAPARRGPPRTGVSAMPVAHAIDAGAARVGT